MGSKADTQGRGNQDVADSPEEYRFVVEFTDDLVAVVDPDGVYRMVNAAFLERRGLERTEVVGRPVRDVVGRETYDKIIGPNLRRCLQGEVVEYEMSYDYPDLGRRHLLVRYFPVHGKEDEVVRVVSVIRDITDHKQAMISLQESEERFRELVENIEEVFWLTEPGEPERVRYVSPAYERIWDRPADELYQNPRSWIESVHPEDQPAVRKTYASFLAG
ncbi:MAG: PAS domain-containing protein, partial [Desulfovibrionales bacterium]